MAGSQDRALEAAIAATRFGLGARPGEIAEAGADPRGWLKAQIRRGGGDDPAPALQGAEALQMPNAAPKPAAAAPGGVAMAEGRMAEGAAMDAAPAASPQPAPAPYAIPEGLASMRQAEQTFLDYQAATKAAKDDPEARRLAAAPLLIEIGHDVLARVRLACLTPASFRERWTLFWCNHFTVAAKALYVAVAVGPFEREAIRPHVFGRFEDLLVASTRHPGMLLYLDQAQSVGPNSPAGRRNPKAGLNENLGREILELHTVGADAGYTQADVTEFARALTGWSVGRGAVPIERQGEFMFRPQVHEPGARTILGRTYADSGEGQARAVLADLANDPRTARRLARKIAAHFIADEPPPSAVARLERAWTSSRGDLATVAAALIDCPEAWSPAGLKFKTPYEFLVSGYRAAGAAPREAQKEVTGPLNTLGQKVFGAPQPNGWSDLAADWAAPDAIVKRLTWAQAFANVYTPQGLQPVDVAVQALGERLSTPVRTAIARAETRQEAFALLLMSPEFQRR